MPPLLRPALRLLPATLVLALVLSWPVLAGPPGAYEVTVVEPDGTTRAVLLNEAKSDLFGEYEVRQADGSVAKVDATDGVSVYSLLRAVGAETGYEAIEVPRPGGGTITLTRKAVEASDPRPPGFFTDDATGKTMFVGFPPPGSRVVPASDYFEIAQSGLRITQDDKPEVSVKVKASRTKIDPGQTVKLTASTNPKGSYSYNWTLEQGVKEDDAGSSISHRFEKRGTYRVVVGVYTSDDLRNSAGSGHVTIQVGDPKQSDKDREGGGDNTAAGAPDSGTTTGSSGAYDGTTYAPSTPAPSTPTPPPPATPDPLVPDVTTSGTPVTGNLLADVSDPPPSNILESAARAARDGNPKDDEGAGADVPEAALSIAGVLALLGLGAGIESRQGRRLSRPRLRIRLPRRGG